MLEKYTLKIKENPFLQILNEIKIPITRIRFREIPMIKLPKYSDQVMYDAETIFHLYMKQERLAKFIVHYELLSLQMKYQAP